MHCNNNNYQIYRYFLEKNDLKWTKQRDIIFTSFNAVEGHFTAQDLYEKIKFEKRKIGLATVQRTLDLFAQCKIAKKIKIDNNTVKYEHNHSEHFHLNCKKCKKLIEIQSPRLLKLIKELAEDEDFTLLSFSVTVSGICKECYNKH